MNEILQRVTDEARSAWRFRWLGMGVAAVVAIVGWIVVFALPDRYEARASVFVDTRTALKPVLKDLAVEQDVNVQLNYVRQSLFSGSSAEAIARESGVLREDLVDPAKIASTLDGFTGRVKLDVRSASGRDSERDTAGSVYSFTYQDSNRARALKATETIVTHFVEQTLGGKREGAEHAQKFLVDQLKLYEERLRVAENRLAEFKKSNIGLMPTEQGGYFTQLQLEIDATRKAENDLNVAQQRRAELMRQLRGDAVLGASSSAIVSPSGVAAGGDTLSRIKEAQARLDELLLRFTDRHPDVIAARSALAELKVRREAEVESLKRGDAGAVAASGVSSNPVFQSIQLQLNQAEVEIASLRGQLAQHRTKAAELKQRLDTAPKVEAEYAQLNRDYDTNKAQYTQLLSNLEKARLGERADNAGSVRFEVVQPPTASYVPVSPRRLLLLAGVLFGAFVAGGGLTYLLHLLKPVISSAKSLAEITDARVLGVVSPAFPAKHRSQMRRDFARFVLAGAALGVVFIVVVLLNFANFRLDLGLGVG